MKAKAISNLQEKCEVIGSIALGSLGDLGKAPGKTHLYVWLWIPDAGRNNSGDALPLCPAYVHLSGWPLSDAGQDEPSMVWCSTRAHFMTLYLGLSLVTEVLTWKWTRISLITLLHRVHTRLSLWDCHATLPHDPHHGLSKGKVSKGFLLFKPLFWKGCWLKHTPACMQACRHKHTAKRQVRRECNLCLVEPGHGLFCANASARDTFHFKLQAKNSSVLFPHPPPHLNFTRNTFIQVCKEFQLSFGPSRFILIENGPLILLLIVGPQEIMGRSGILETST